MSRNYFDDLADRLAALDGVGVEYGLNDSQHPSGMTAAQLGRLLYEGKGKGNTARDFFADADEEVERRADKHWAKVLRAAYKGTSPARALGDLADMAELALYRSIDRYNAVPNKPSTIRRKGFNKPLYEFGDLIDCVVAVVVDNAGADAGEADTP